MAQFLEERLPICIKYGGSFSEAHAVSMVETVGGDEYRTLRHPYVKLSYDVSYEQRTKFITEQILGLYSRCNGTFRGFRVKDQKDFTTNNYVNPPTALDQPMTLVSPGVYQLMRWYGTPTDPLAARRRLRKPVEGTVLIAFGGQAIPLDQVDLDYTTGLVKLPGLAQATVTGISKASKAVVTVPAHTFTVGQSVVLSGVEGMTQINGRRAIISRTTTNTIALDLDSTAFSDYASGGQAQNLPLAGEQVTAGCEFDIPARFADDLSAAFSNLDILDADGIEIVEILNP